MGRYQAIRDGEHAEIAAAMDEIYMPRFSGDQLPQSKTGIAVALADRFDTLTGIFGIGLKPTGTKDPFALRRASLGIIRILREHSLSLNILDLIESSSKLHGSNITNPETVPEVSTYINERLRGVFIEEGISSALVTSVGSVNPVTLTDFEKRIEAVTAFSQLPQADNLAAANKRIHNILKKTTDRVPETTDTALFETEQEKVLFNKVATKELELQPLIQNSEYRNILVSLADLKDPIDEFFDHVMVMTENDDVRLNRLSLLSRVYQLFIKVADVSVLQES
jgi:glycyl-tRNA synthetase beta chain